MYRQAYRVGAYRGVPFGWFSLGVRVDDSALAIKMIPATAAAVGEQKSGPETVVVWRCAKDERENRNGDGSERYCDVVNSAPAAPWCVEGTSRVPTMNIDV